MIQIIMDSADPEPHKISHPIFLLIGAPLIIVTSLLASRIVWEETWLSLHQGPQMIGFSLAHGPEAIFLVVPFVLLFWLVAAFIAMGISLWRRQSLSKLFWASLDWARCASCVDSPSCLLAVRLDPKFCKVDLCGRVHE
jgi:hypothetical protein